MMTFQETMRQLESMGTAQNRKVYQRHGMGENLYGVSFANLGVLKKKIKADNALARQLWASGNADARYLATMIADPASITALTVDSWAKDLTNRSIAGLFADLVAKTPFARRKADQWVKSRGEWTGTAGWNVIALLARDNQDLTDDYFAAHLATIAGSIHSAKNYTRHAMNNALIAIALRNASLEKQAVAMAVRIGTVEVDHGETGCKTPDAVAYIRKAKARGKR